MASTFIALPLSSGESFLLRTTDSAGRDRTILVDGGIRHGKKSRELAKKLKEVGPRISHIDIVVCTHSDADHAQGLWHFADDWYDMGRTIGEFWLPGRWAHAMPAILLDLPGFISSLAEGSSRLARRMRAARTQAEDENERALPREALLRHLYDNRADLEDEGLSPGLKEAPETPSDDDDPVASAFGLTPEELDSLAADLGEADAVEPLDWPLDRHQPWRLSPELIFLDDDLVAIEPAPLSEWTEAEALFAEVVDTAKAIRKIAKAALTRRIRIRWFDFGKYEENGKPGGGEAGLLQPVCSVEVVPDGGRAGRLSALALVLNLRLTRQNVESLVFYRPETSSSPGVLFLGDSRLAHGIQRPGPDFPIPFPAPSRKLLVTAPHHGSDHNDNAYAVLLRWLGEENALFARNGGQSNQRLGEYLVQGERRCAQCVQCHGRKWRQWVSVTATGNAWHWPPSAESCGRPLDPIRC